MIPEKKARDRAARPDNKGGERHLQRSLPPAGQFEIPPASVSAGEEDRRMTRGGDEAFQTELSIRGLPLQIVGVKW